MRQKISSLQHQMTFVKQDTSESLMERQLRHSKVDMTDTEDTQQVSDECIPSQTNKKQKREITTTKTNFEDLTEMASVALFEGCYKENEDETCEWLKALEKKVDNEEEPPSPKWRKTTNTQFPQCVAGLRCSKENMKNQMTRIATQVASITTSQTQIKKDIKDLQGEIIKNFDYEDEDRYEHCHKEK